MCRTFEEPLITASKTSFVPAVGGDPETPGTLPCDFDCQHQITNSIFLFMPIGPSIPMKLSFVDSILIHLA